MVAGGISGVALDFLCLFFFGDPSTEDGTSGCIKSSFCPRETSCFNVDALPGALLEGPSGDASAFTSCLIFFLRRCFGAVTGAEVDGIWVMSGEFITILICPFLGVPFPHFRFLLIYYRRLRNTQASTRGYNSQFSGNSRFMWWTWKQFLFHKYISILTCGWE